MVPTDQFPIFKLVTLLARQLSAPVAARVKEYAKTHPRFSRSVCMRAARVFRGAELNYKLWLLGVRRPRRAPPLSDREALDVGADLLGETVIFTLGASIVVFEVNRQAAKQEMKVLEERSQMVAVLAALEELQLELARQQADMDRLRERLLRLTTDLQPTVNSASAK